jgi:hypothetical protein
MTVRVEPERESLKTDSKRAGLLVRVEETLWFIPAAIAVRVASAPRVTPVPGAPPELLGIALHAGVVLPVIAIGPTRSEMVVCQHGGELVGVVGGSTVRSGAFDVPAERPDLIEYLGTRVHSLDLQAIYGRVQSGVCSDFSALRSSPGRQ